MQQNLKTSKLDNKTTRSKNRNISTKRLFAQYTRLQKQKNDKKK